MPDLQEMLQSKEARALAADKARLEKLRDAPDTQRLLQLLSQSAGGELERCANRAAQGDAKALMAAIDQLMKDPEGQQLLNRMRQAIE